MDCRCNRNDVTAYHIAAGMPDTIGLDLNSDYPLKEGDAVTAYFTAGHNPSFAVAGDIDGNKVMITLSEEQTAQLGEYADAGHRIHMCAHVSWAEGDSSPITFGGTDINPIYELPIRVTTCHHV